MNKANQKLNVIIVILVIGIIIVSSVLVFNFINKKNNTFNKDIIFSLKGEEKVVVYVDSIYNDPGVIALKNDVDISSKVVVNGKVNTKVIGVYLINYTLIDDNNNTKTLTREVEVKYIDGISLNGSSDIYILLNGKYQDSGFVAYYNNSDVKEKVVVTNNIDFSKSGDYQVTYTYLEYVVKRNIHVSDFSDYFKVSYDKNITNKDILLDISIDKEKISKVILPNNNELRENSTYLISENNKYSFVIYDLYNNSYTYDLNITNIDKIPLNMTCKAIVSGNMTSVTVNSNKKISKYFYNDNESTNATYSFNSRVNSVKVKVVDEFGNDIVSACSVEYRSNNIEMHFIASGNYDDAILIRTDDKTIFIDGGRYNCKDKVLAYLKDLGINKIDALIGSHVQNDHIATQAAILDNLSVDTIYYPDNIKTCASRGSCESIDQQYIVNALNCHNKTPVVVSAPKLIEIGEMKLYFIGPPKVEYNVNNNSFIFILKFRDNTFMFTGDSYSPLNDVDTLKSNASSLGIGIDVDMLKYPHHGNKTLQTSFLEAITPKYVIVPNYLAPNYPRENDRNRIASVGGAIYRQSDSPNILVTSDGKNINVTLNIKASDYKRNW